MTMVRTRNQTQRCPRYPSLFLVAEASASRAPALLRHTNKDPTVTPSPFAQQRSRPTPSFSSTARAFEGSSFRSTQLRRTSGDTHYDRTLFLSYGFKCNIIKAIRWIPPSWEFHGTEILIF
ncbi:hypothetical protein V6N13_134667 [Hibiscus sabdariffa]